MDNFEIIKMKECHICLVSHSENNFFTLHDSHEVCNNCLKNLQKNYITACPFCRETLSPDIFPRRPAEPENQNFGFGALEHLPIDLFNIVNESVNLPLNQQRQIDRRFLLSRGISEQFLESYSDRLPFNYTSRFEAAAFIVEVSDAFDRSIQHFN